LHAFSVLGGKFREQDRLLNSTDGAANFVTETESGLINFRKLAFRMTQLAGLSCNVKAFLAPDM
jgi:hypothetical protein